MDSLTPWLGHLGHSQESCIPVSVCSTWVGLGAQKKAPAAPQPMSSVCQRFPIISIFYEIPSRDKVLRRPNIVAVTEEGGQSFSRTHDWRTQGSALFRSLCTIKCARHSPNMSWVFLELGAPESARNSKRGSIQMRHYFACEGEKFLRKHPPTRNSYGHKSLRIIFRNF